MFRRDEIIWGFPPGRGPALRNMVEEETRRANRSWPGLWFFGFILLLFLILFPIFLAWDLISPRTFRESSFGSHSITTRVREHRSDRFTPAKRLVPQSAPARITDPFSAN